MGREHEIAAICARLARLDIEKAELEAYLTRLHTTRETEDSPPSVKDAPVTNASSPASKIAFFRSLFRGPEEVFPKRWDNTRTGKAGYAPLHWVCFAASSAKISVRAIGVSAGNEVARRMKVARNASASTGPLNGNSGN